MNKNENDPPELKIMEKFVDELISTGKVDAAIELVVKYMRQIIVEKYPDLPNIVNFSLTDIFKDLVLGVLLGGGFAAYLTIPGIAESTDLTIKRVLEKWNEKQC